MGNITDEQIQYAVKNIWLKPDATKGAECKKILEDAVNEGNPDAHFYLARTYFGPCFVDRRFGFPENDELGEELLEKSMELGSAIGMFCSVRVGGFKPKRQTNVYPPYTSMGEIFNVISEKANNGDDFCLYLIANAFYYLDIIDIFNLTDFNYENAVEATQTAAGIFASFMDKGYSIGLSNLYNIYNSGEYLEKNENYVNTIISYGAEIGVGMFERLLAEKYEDSNPAYAKELYERAISHGDTNAYSWLGGMYTFDGKLPLNVPVALDLFKKAYEYEPDSTYVNNCLGQLYFYGGQGISPDYEKAYKHFLVSRPNNSWCSDMLGTLYLRGIGGAPRDYAKAMSEFEQTPNNVLSTQGMAEIYLYGLGVKQDIKKGMSLLKLTPNHPRTLENMKHFKKTLFGWEFIK